MQATKHGWQIRTWFVVATLMGFVVVGCAGGSIEGTEYEVNHDEENAVESNDTSNQDSNDDSNQGSNDDSNHQSANDEAPEKSRSVSAISFSAGGGKGYSQNYETRLSIGTPAPAGKGKTERYQVIMGMGPAVEVGQ